jgi:phage N-6-adenine-methyltransferase
MADQGEGAMTDDTTIATVRTGPTVRRGQSKQDYGTPREFILAVEKRLGALAWDLAATPENAKAPQWITPELDSFGVDWLSLPGNHWLNPPFADIAPWAAKCAPSMHRSAFTFLLVPASIGANWFNDHVIGKAFILGLSPRMTFEGTTDPYPKDLMLCVYGFGLHGFDTWRWK